MHEEITSNCRLKFKKTCHEILFKKIETQKQSSSGSNISKFVSMIPYWSIRLDMNLITFHAGNSNQLKITTAPYGLVYLNFTILPGLSSSNEIAFATNLTLRCKLFNLF